MLDLQPGQSQILQTFIGHTWMVQGSGIATGRTILQANETFEFGNSGNANNGDNPNNFNPRPAPAPEVNPNFNGPGFNGPPNQPSGPSSSLGQAILNFANSSIGRKIGNGQCTELAIAALQAAGARPNQGYVWGTALRGPDELQPGDIIQMFDARFNYGNRQAWSTGPHTAVVISANGTEIQVLEQNISGSPVQKGAYDIKAMTAGRMEYYRPIAGGGNSNNGWNNGNNGGGNNGWGGNNNNNGWNSGNNNGGWNSNGSSGWSWSWRN